jgi:hypothetical protein
MNWPYSKLILGIAVCLVCALPAVNLLARQNTPRANAAQQTRTEPNMVLSARRLDPALHGGHRRVVFSPDGKYLLAQDDGGITLFTRKPLAERFHVSLVEALPAAFTADSQSVVIATNLLQYEVLSVTGKVIIKAKNVEPDTQECQTAVLSPAGNVLACLDVSSNLHIFDIASGKERAKFAATPSLFLPFALAENISDESAFSEPFGVIIGASEMIRGSSQRAQNLFRVSPDGRYLLFKQPLGEMLALDLKTDQKINLPGSLKYRSLPTIEFVSGDRVAAMDVERAGNSELIGFPSGEKLSKLGLAGMIRRASSPNYALYNAPEGSEIEVLDLTTHHVVSRLEDPASDVWGQEIATYTDYGNLQTSNFEGTKLDGVAVAAEWLAKLSAANATPDLGTLVMGTGEAAAFDTESGKRIATLKNARGTWCASSTECYVEVMSKEPGGFDVKKFVVSSGDVETAWTHTAPNPKDHSKEPLKEKGFYEPSGSIILQQTPNPGNAKAFGMSTTTIGVLPLQLDHTGLMLPYNLQGLDLKTGNGIWKRSFGENPPVPFSDPQGNRIVLGWGAATEGARKATKGNAIAEEAMRAEKKKSHDIYFEILDARSGKTIGGVLVESNAPADTYDEAVSQGDWLVLAKDGQRVMVESLSKGQEILRLRGWMPAIHAATATLSLSPELGQLELYDLKSGQKLKNYRFPAPIAYTRFSAGGGKLLVVTQDQEVFVLDVSKIREDAAAPAN